MNYIQKQVSTSEASDIAGWKRSANGQPEALRDALQDRKIRREGAMPDERRDGLLKRAGVIPPFVAKGEATPEPRGVPHRRFGFNSLCSLTLARRLLDLGHDFDAVNALVSSHDVWERWARDEVFAEVMNTPRERFLIVPAKALTDYLVCESGELAAALIGGFGGGDHALAVIPLHNIRTRVRAALEAE